MPTPFQQICADDLTELRALRGNVMATDALSLRPALDRFFNRLNLHGNAKKKERAPDGGKDENVFDIQQGVAILLGVKQSATCHSERSEESHCGRISVIL